MGRRQVDNAIKEDLQLAVRPNVPRSPHSANPQQVCPQARKRPIVDHQDRAERSIAVRGPNGDPNLLDELMKIFVTESLQNLRVLQ